MSTRCLRSFAFAVVFLAKDCHHWLQQPSRSLIENLQRRSRSHQSKRIDLCQEDRPIVKRETIRQAGVSNTCFPLTLMHSLPPRCRRLPPAWASGGDSTLHTQHFQMNNIWILIIVFRNSMAHLIGTHRNRINNFIVYICPKLPLALIKTFRLLVCNPDKHSYSCVREPHSCWGVSRPASPESVGRSVLDKHRGGLFGAGRKRIIYINI